MAILTSSAFEVFGKFRRSPGRARGAGDHSPDPVADLKVFDILRNIIQPPQQAERVANGGERRCAEACRHAQPGLLTQLDHDAFLEGLNRHRHRRLPARHRPRTSAHLHNNPVFIPQRLRPQVALVKLRQERLGDTHRLDLSVKDFPLHELDYNRVCDSSKKCYEMTISRFQAIFPALFVFSLVIGLASASFPNPALAQQPTETPPAESGLFVTVITTEPQINVRLGPSSTIYPIVGALLTGSTAPALGRSPGGDWIQIEFPSAPGGVGWVYSPLVQVSPPGNLRVIEPPPTPVPPATSTIDPTLAAQFIVEPTNTRLPTFTPPPTLAPRQFSPASSSQNDIPWASIIIALFVLGITGFLLSLIRR